jgi:hypothetical protein
VSSFGRNDGGLKARRKEQQQQIPFGDDNKKSYDRDSYDRDSCDRDRTGGTYSSEKTRQTRPTM